MFNNQYRLCMGTTMMQMTLLLYYVSTGQKTCHCCQQKKPCCTWWHCNFTPKQFLFLWCHTSNIVMVLWQHLQRHWQFILIIKTQKEILPLACTKQWDIALVGWLNTMKEIWRKAESGDSLQFGLKTGISILQHISQVFWSVFLLNQ